MIHISCTVCMLNFIVSHHVYYDNNICSWEVHIVYINFSIVYFSSFFSYLVTCTSTCSNNAPSTSGNTTRGVSGNIIVIYIIYFKVFILQNQVRKLNLTLQQYTMYCYAVYMHERQVYNIFNYVKQFTVQVKSTIHNNCTMCNCCRYKGIQNTCKETCNYWFWNHGFGQKTSRNNTFAK